MLAYSNRKSPYNSQVIDQSQSYRSHTKVMIKVQYSHVKVTLILYIYCGCAYVVVSMETPLYSIGEREEVSGETVC
jgi:hypothetical protein